MALLSPASLIVACADDDTAAGFERHAFCANLGSDLYEEIFEGRYAEDPFLADIAARHIYTDAWVTAAPDELVELASAAADGIAAKSRGELTADEAAAYLEIWDRLNDEAEPHCP